MINEILYKSTFGKPQYINRNTLKAFYNNFCEGATACEDKPKTFYKYHVLAGITYEEFLNLVKEVK